MAKSFKQYFLSRSTGARRTFPVSIVTAGMLRRRGPLTDAEDDDEDDEGVHHGDDGGGDGGDHGLEGLDAAEEADDAEGPHELDEPVGDGGHRVGGEGGAHDEDVEPVPAVDHEAAEPVAEEVKDELDGESESEEHVDALVDLANVREASIVVGEEGEKLGVEDARCEILRHKSLSSMGTFVWAGRDEG